MRPNPVAAVILVFMGFQVVLRLQPQAPAPAPPPRTIQSPPARSFAVLFGIGSNSVLTWTGTVSATGANILATQGWRFEDPDKITNTTSTSFTFSFRTKESPSASTSGRYYEENGFLITAADNSSPVNFTVSYCASPPSCTQNSTFTFSSQQASFEGALSFQGGAALVYQVPAVLQLTSSMEEEDYPAMAQSGDDVYLAYTRFVHGNRNNAQPLRISSPKDLPNLAVLAQAAGGDQVLVLHYSKSKRVWTGPLQITSPGEDIMRTAVTVDGQGLAWVFYSARRSDNSDIFARSISAAGAVSAEIRITTDPVRTCGRWPPRTAPAARGSRGRGTATAGCKSSRRRSKARHRRCPGLRPRRWFPHRSAAVGIRPSRPLPMGRWRSAGTPMTRATTMCIFGACI